MNIEQQEQVYKDVLSRINSEIEKALAEGYDENDEFVQKLRDLYKEAADNIVNTMMDAYDDYIKYVDDFDLWRNLDFTKADVLKSQMSELKRLYSQDLISWKDYVDKHNEIGETLYDTYKGSIDEIINLTMEMIQQEADDQIEALEKSEKKYQDILDLKKKILQATKDQVDHELEVEDAVRSLSKLQSRYNQLLLDDSREAAAKRAELEEQIFQAQRSLTQLQADYSTEKTIEALDEQGDAYSKTVDAETQLIEKSVDTWVKRYNKAIELINSDWNGLYSKLEQYQLKHRNSIDGMDSLKTAWDNANDAAKTYMGTMNNIINLRNTIGNEIGISPYDASVGANGTVTLSGTGTTKKHADTNPNKKQAESLLKEMKENADDWKESGNDWKKVLEARNQKIGKTELPKYGITPTFNSASGEWRMAGENLFEWAKKNGYVFHDGGIIGGKGTRIGEELMAVVKTGELVLNDEQQKNLAKILSGPNKALMSLLGTYTMKPTGVPGVGETFAPNIEVNVTATPGTRDSDARRYGEIAADAALDRLYDAFKRRGK